jgi:hypothetical protein
MRLRCALILFLTFAAVSSAATIVEAYTRHMDVGQFQLLREFFTGQESTGNRSIFRTDPEVRTGQYFVIGLDERIDRLPPGAYLVLEVVSTEDLKPVPFRFDLDGANKPSTRRLYLGLTGEAWPSPERKALAWRVQLRHGESIDSEWKSFLWEMP